MNKSKALAGIEAAVYYAAVSVLKELHAQELLDETADIEAAALGMGRAAARYVAFHWRDKGPDNDE